MKTQDNANGFTLIELVTIIAIISILGCLGTYYYMKYQDKARSADVISSWHTIKLTYDAYLASSDSGRMNCTQVQSILPSYTFNNKYVNLSMGFSIIDQQHAKPVLNFCATSSKPHSFSVARINHGYFDRMNLVEPGAIIKDSLISYSVPLADDFVCTGVIPKPQGACLSTPTMIPPITAPSTTGKPAITPAPVTTPSVTQKPASTASVSTQQSSGQSQTTTKPQQQSTSQPAASNNGCAAGLESVQLHHGHNYYTVCVPPCPPGTRRTSGNNTHCR